MIASAHAARESAPADPSLAHCQTAAAAASARYARDAEKLADACRGKGDRGPQRGCEDTERESRLARSRATLQARVGAACTDAAVVSLQAEGGFGGSCAAATSAAELASCLVADDDAALDTLAALWSDAVFEGRLWFEVPPGTALLRVTLNGSEEHGGVFHLHLAHDRAALPSDPGSVLDSGFQAVEIPAPAAGTWHALVRSPDRAGETIGAWQLTATSFP